MLGGKWLRHINIELSSAWRSMLWNKMVKVHEWENMISIWCRSIGDKHDKWLMVGVEWNSWYVILFAPLKPIIERKIYVSIILIIQINSRNFVVPSDFVNPSATLSYVATQSKMIDPSFTNFQDLWYLIGISFVFQ